MKKKSKTIKSIWANLNNLNYKNKNKEHNAKEKSGRIFSPTFSTLSILFLFLIIPILSLFLAGCAKTGYPQPPKIMPPQPPVILSAYKHKHAIRIVYKYSGDLKKIKGFLLYDAYYKNKRLFKNSCAGSKPFAFQNLSFKKRFSLQYNEFFYNVDKRNLKSGFYVFCAKSVGYYDVKSIYSNYITVKVIM